MYKFLNETPNLNTLYKDIRDISQPIDQYSKDVVQDFLFYYAAIEPDFKKVKKYLTKVEEDEEKFILMFEVLNVSMPNFRIALENYTKILDKLYISKMANAANCSALEMIVAVIYTLLKHEKYTLPKSISFITSQLMEDGNISLMSLAMYPFDSEAVNILIKNKIFGFYTDHDLPTLEVSSKEELKDGLFQELEDIFDRRLVINLNDSPKIVPVYNLTYKEHTDASL